MRREKPIYKYGKSCEKIEHTRDIFHLNMEVHAISTRGAEKYKVIRTNTDKFTISTVPYIHRKLDMIEKTLWICRLDNVCTYSKDHS